MNQTSGMANINCIHCGRPIAPGSRLCLHCDGPAKAKTGIGRLILKSVIRMSALILIVLFLAYTSLITSSEPILHDQQQLVNKAIDVIEQRGFSTDVFLLRRIVRFRGTDNWWNRHNGHQTAYASTNFPFEVVTLYPQFFDDSTDAVERAAILLHESYHLRGYGEPGAFEGAWKDRFQLGWVQERYGFTLVWASVRESTQHWAPQLFECGVDGRSDCTEARGQR